MLHRLADAEPVVDDREGARKLVGGEACAGDPSCGTVGETTSYRYDGLDRQVQATTETAASTLKERIDLTYVGLDQNLYTELSTDSAGTARYTTANDQALAVAGASQWHALSSDGQGSVTTALSSTGIACSVDLSAWGVPRNASGNDNPCVSGSSPNSRWFNGGRRDDNTQNYQAGARTYSPGNASWMQADSDRGTGAPSALSIGTDPLLINRYAYVNGDPVNLVDPTGHYSCADEACLMSGTGFFKETPREKTAASEFDGETSHIPVSKSAEINAEHGGSANCTLGPKGEITVYSEEHGYCGVWKKEHSRGLRQQIANFSGGVLNAITFDQAKNILTALELDEKVDFDSTAFKAGEITATIVDAKGAITGLGKAGLRRLGAKGAAKVGDEAVGLADEGVDLVKGAARGSDEGSDVARAVTNASDDSAAAARSAGDAPKACNSFVPGTAVLMADGSTKAIEDVELGDEVWATDPETGEEGPREVTRLITGHGDKTLVDLEIDGQVVTATDHHPIWVDSDGKWVDAEDVQVGDYVLDDTGVTLVVDDVEIRQVTGQTVHNLTVDDIHTYFVLAGDRAVLTHNDSCPVEGVGTYRPVGGHHIHAKAAFKNVDEYSSASALSISQDAMRSLGIDHTAVTAAQRTMFDDLARSGIPNTMRQHNRIAVDALVAGGATRSLARDLVAASLRNLRQQGVRQPGRIPWNL